MKRRNFIRVAGGGCIAAATVGTAGLAGCSPAMPPGAIEAWQGPTPDAVASPDPRRWLLSYAILAPHAHNLQSWIVDLGTPDEIVLHCDLQRLLPQTDPLSRQIMMSHGAFLELLDLAARERGLRADIDLFPLGVFGPDKPDLRPVARIRLKADATVQKDPLFAQILRRRTNREYYERDLLVSESAWSAMAEAVKPYPLRFGRVSSLLGESLVAHREIAEDAWHIEVNTARTVTEFLGLLRVGSTEIAEHRDGMASLDPVLILLKRMGFLDHGNGLLAGDYVRDTLVEEINRRIDSAPGFFWLLSDANDRVTQVNAGRAYVRVNMAATAHNVAMQPLSQALQEYPEQKETYHAIHVLTGAARAGQTVQMWARVGYASPVRPAPRRRLKDFIHT